MKRYQTALRVTSGTGLKPDHWSAAPPETMGRGVKVFAEGPLCTDPSMLVNTRARTRENRARAVTLLSSYRGGEGNEAPQRADPLLRSRILHSSQAVPAGFVPGLARRIAGRFRNVDSLVRVLTVPLGVAFKRFCQPPAYADPTAPVDTALLSPVYAGPSALIRAVLSSPICADPSVLTLSACARERPVYVQ
ncbi:hypothetical protein SKAU_G00106720 [Synaphobranchus kaupii]|uniref:Uncharacterized protein n=1 Tax=Synaphobranchus kaupii TaxID=118154 RepID=A0A9Q1FZC2_SYNKA|nr:hypothetical protein SKAU_G00106720 [Synaphobranchus kaupii]